MTSLTVRKYIMLQNLQKIQTVSNVDCFVLLFMRKKILQFENNKGGAQAQ